MFGCALPRRVGDTALTKQFRAQLASHASVDPSREGADSAVLAAMVRRQENAALAPGNAD
jgi:hypothetical protein